MDINEIREFLSYDPAAGEFRWIKKPSIGVEAGDIAGTTSGEGYRKIKFRGRVFRAARLAWFFVHGSLPQGLVDHRNGNKSDDRIDNLREATRSQNTANSRPRRNSKSGFKGVHFRHDLGRWQAQIKAGGTAHHLGYFATAKAASRAYDAAAIKHFGEFAFKGTE